MSLKFWRPKPNSCKVSDGSKASESCRWSFKASHLLQISVVRRSYQRSAYCILWLRLTIHQFNGLRPVSNLGAVLVQFPLKTTEQLEGALALPRAVSSYRSRRRYRSDNLSREQFGDSFSKRDDEVEKSTEEVRAVFDGSVPACTLSPSLVTEYC